LKISDVEFQSIGKILEGLPFLEKISLDIERKDDSRGREFAVNLKYIGEALRKLEFLQEIYLNFSWFVDMREFNIKNFRMRIEGEGLFYFAESLKKVGGSLKKISLDFKQYILKEKKIIYQDVFRCWRNLQEVRNIEEDLERFILERDGKLVFLY